MSQSTYLKSHFVRVKLEEDWWGRGYRVSHCRTRQPVSYKDEDIWVTNYTFPLPQSGLSEDEVRSLIAELDARAQERYEEEAETIESLNERFEDRTHEEPDYDFVTEDRTGDGPQVWLA
jgi:hypothetical protein